jgi:Tfp pilus assembly protein PilW
MVFSIILGTVVTLLVKSQTIFRAEQGVSEMDQNARLLMDFLTRDPRVQGEQSWPRSEIQVDLFLQWH